MRLSAPGIGPLRHAPHLVMGVVGAESNVAIGVRRLGVESAWLGRVGDDEFGRLVTTTIRGEGVATRAVIDSGAPTAVIVTERRVPGVIRVQYYRAGSAGSHLCVDDLDASLITSASVLHVTGITPALSVTARQAVFSAVEFARGAGVTVSFDLNYRSSLWSHDEAAPVLGQLARLADIVFAGSDEAELLVGARSPHEQVAALAAFGPRHAVVKLGRDGAVAQCDGARFDQSAFPTTEVDSVGAGDAFVAGYLARYVAGHPASECLRVGALLGAFAVTVQGDWEGLPSERELTLLDNGTGYVVR